MNPLTSRWPRRQQCSLKGTSAGGEKKGKAKKTHGREGWQSCPHLRRPEFSHPCLGGSGVALKPGCGRQMQATPSTRWHTVVIYTTIALGQTHLQGTREHPKMFCSVPNTSRHTYHGIPGLLWEKRHRWSSVGISQVKTQAKVLPVGSAHSVSGFKLWTPGEAQSLWLFFFFFLLV